MRLYIAGPMTGYPNYNFDAFNTMSRALTKAGHEVYNPATSFKGRQDLPYDIYLRHAIQMVTMCDGLVLLAGWDNSKGALTEAHVALACGMPLYIAYGGELIEQSFDLAGLAKDMYWKYITQPGLPEPSLWVGEVDNG